MGARPYGIVAHEAAHVVVGVALGLRLRSAVVREWYERGEARDAWTWFYYSTKLEDSLVLAAGVAWSRATGDGLAGVDERDLRKRLGYKTRGGADYEALIVAAAAILETRAVAHARVVRALIEHDLTGEDITRIATGVNPSRLREEDAA